MFNILSQSGYNVYFSQQTTNQTFNELFIHFDLSKRFSNNKVNRTGKPVNTAVDWTGHMTSSENY